MKEIKNSAKVFVSASPTKVFKSNAYVVKKLMPTRKKFVPKCFNIYFKDKLYKVKIEDIKIKNAKKCR